jgi:hypothetical protein
MTTTAILSAIAELAHVLPLWAYFILVAFVGFVYLAAVALRGVFRMLGNCGPPRGWGHHAGHRRGSRERD